MVEGRFKRLSHIHDFESKEGMTMMRDTLTWEAPFGFIGHFADRLFLRRHLRQFVTTKQSNLKRIAEARAKKQ